MKTAAHKDYFQVSIGAAHAFADHDEADFALYLPGQPGEAPILYRDAGAELSLPDFRRLRESGVESLFVRSPDFHRCEVILENSLAKLLGDQHIEPEEKAEIVEQVATTVARDLAKSPSSSNQIQRSSQVVGHIISAVLQDKEIAVHLLRMAEHERTTANHMCVVSTLAVLLGAEVFGNDHSMLTNLGLAGLMHDLGKLQIDTAILNKTTALSQEELDLIHQHPIESVRLVGNDPHITVPVRQMIVQHHERVDGKGYPLGVRGLDLMPGSRILTIVDCFHAMIGQRAYRPPLTPTEANRALRTQANRQFDPEMLKCWEHVACRGWGNSRKKRTVVKLPGQDTLPTRHEHQPKAFSRTSYGERRKRFESNGLVAIRCMYVERLPDTTAAPDDFKALLRDVSGGGLSFQCDHPMYRGEVLNVRLEQVANPLWVRGDVAWCRLHGEGQYKIGLRFVRKIKGPTDDESTGGVDAFDNGEDWSARLIAMTNAMNHDGEEVIQLDDCERQVLEIEHFAAMRIIERDSESLVIELAKSDHPSVRIKTIEVLGKIGTMPARKAILTLLKDEDADIRERAVGVAGALKMCESSYILRQCLKDSVEVIALRAAGALGKMGEKDGLAVVETYLGGNESTARLAAQMLGQIVGHRFSGNTEGIKAARRYLSSGKSKRKV